MPGVFLAIPCSDKPRFSRFWMELLTLQRPEGSILASESGPFITQNQNKLALRFLETTCEWFFLANDDQFYPSDTLPTLISCGKEAIVGVVVHRKPPHIPLIYDLLEDGHFHCHNLKPSEDGLVRIDGSGGGGLLLHRSIFYKIPHPWWGLPNSGQEGGEDLHFCRRLKASGIELWCNTNVRIGHAASFILTPEHNPGQPWAVRMDRI